MENATPNTKGSVQKSKHTMWAAVILAVFLLVGFLLWVLYFSPEAKKFHADRANMAQYEKGMAEYQEKMKNDTYGGKTPEETLMLFTEALKKDDLELASKYFAVNSKINWLDVLKKAKEENKLFELISIISKDYTREESVKDFDILVFKNKENESLVIDFSLNKYSGVWKIESL